MSVLRRYSSVEFKLYIYTYIYTQKGKTALQLVQNLPSWKSREKDEVVALLTEHTACGGRK